MHKLSCFRLSAAAVAFAGLVGVEARSAELEGALQYPPPSVGEDAQPPPPKRCRNSHPRDASSWASAGQARRLALSYF
jgi:hypothetical protein